MQKVDAEIRRIIDERYRLARKLIEDNSDKVEVMAKALLEWETIDADQVKTLWPASRRVRQNRRHRLEARLIRRPGAVRLPRRTRRLHSKDGHVCGAAHAW